jgi:hypothetical protein
MIFQISFQNPTSILSWFGFFLGKELLPSFGSHQRSKGKIGLQGELREVGMVVRCEVEHGHNAARGARGGLTQWHTVGQERGGIGVEWLS